MKKPIPLDQLNDHPAMCEAVAWCRANNIPVRRSTQFQLKYGPINFWPEKGTIHVDELGTLSQKGLTVFKALLGRPHQSLQEIAAACKELDLLPEKSRTTLFL
jgi:hypothetical protein